MSPQPFRHNIAHHMARAAYWEAQGRPDYAAGSRAKAERWRKRQADLESLFRPKLPDIDGPLAALVSQRMEAIASKLANEMEAQIYGR